MDFPTSISRVKQKILHFLSRPTKSHSSMYVWERYTLIIVCACANEHVEAVDLLKMASEFLAVQIRRGTSVLLALQTVRVSLQSTFWDVFEDLVLHLPERAGRAYHTTDITSVHIARITKLLPSESQSVELSHEVSVCLLFDCRFILFMLAIVSIIVIPCERRNLFKGQFSLVLTLPGS